MEYEINPPVDANESVVPVNSDDAGQAEYTEKVNTEPSATVDQRPHTEPDVTPNEQISQDELTAAAVEVGADEPSENVVEEDPYLRELDILADQINTQATEIRSKHIELGRLLLVARSKFPNHPLGRHLWKRWSRAYIKLKPSRVRQLMKIAKADNPDAEEKRQKKLGKARAEKSRIKKRETPSRNGDENLTTDQLRLISWVREATATQVRHILAEVEKLGNDMQLAETTQIDPVVAVASAVTPADANNDNIVRTEDNRVDAKAEESS